MDFQRVVNRRRMVRNYDPDRPVPPDVVDRLTRNALHAPSAGFSQGWGFLVLIDAADRDLFWVATAEPDELESEADKAFVERLQRAPLIIVCFSNKRIYLDRYAEPDKGDVDRDESRWPAPYWDIDTGMAALLILLTAVDEDLGACFFAVSGPCFEPLRTAFGVPGDYHPIGAITIGYPGDDPLDRARFRSRRRPVGDAVHRGRWDS